MSDMFDKINENAARVAEEHNRERARRAELVRQKVNQQILRRIVTAAALILAFCICSWTGLVDPLLSAVVVSGVFVWAAVWIGAWMQFKWGRRGLLR